MAKLIRELVDIPERVHKGDFVLRLSEGVARPEETLRDYVVTDELQSCFQKALDMVQRSLEGRRSMGAILHGSFGSGKSHFMAVLHLLLQHNPDARSIPALAPVVARHHWTEGKRFLLVPFHLLGGPDTLEQAVLGGYVEHLRRLHPEAPLPAVYLADSLFANARSFRAEMGDEKFFAQLNRGKASQSGWGAFAAAPWDAGRFAEAMEAGPMDARRLGLVSDLVTHMFAAYQAVAVNQGEAFIALDRGLSVISRHAQSLGYDGLVLFLDELVLWLASRVADMAFVGREAAKVAKLVEAETADRPVPIISFIARQRDLRDLVGDHLPGAEKLSFSDTLKYSEGRFETIRLEDRNLPAIARQRLLKPYDEAARLEIDQAFKETQRVRQEVLAALLGREGNPESFRDVYPFSPALVQALVAISSMLQRERTALRVMLQLLVDQRETLRLGDLVPLGDLFDVIAEGDDPFTEEMRIRFDRAKRLYYQKLLPMLERQHMMTRDEARARPHDDPAAHNFRGSDRLVKTLLLAALAPDVEAFQGMDATRLAALNHGSIRAPIPGGEARTVLTRSRTWASQVDGIKIGDDAVNPTITLQLTGVDTESILEKAKYMDNDGNRKRVIRELLAAELGLPEAAHDEQRLLPEHNFLWRGIPWRVEVVFANLWETPRDALRPRIGGEDWKLVIDLPFDIRGHSSRDDLSRLEEFRDQEPDTPTFCWVPAFFTFDSLRDLGTYVILDFLLTGERFGEHASHLAAVDRAAARALLENRRSQLKQRMISCLEAAYGVTGNTAGLVDASLEPAERFQSLDRRFQPRPPAAANLRDALTGVLDQIQSYRFPRHPKFEIDIRTRDLKKVLDVAEQAAHAPLGRLEVERDRDLRNLLLHIASPLELGTLHESIFLLSDRWKGVLTRGAASAQGAVTVGRLRTAIDPPDQPDRLGLTNELKDLLIQVFAEQTNRSFFRNGAPSQPELNLTDDMELREQKLPAEATWTEAQRRAAVIFGLTPPSTFLSASNVSLLQKSLQEKAQALREPCADLVRELRQWMINFGVEPAATPRLQTAEALLDLVDELTAARPDQTLEVLTAARIATTVEAMCRSEGRTLEMLEALRKAPAEVLTGLQGISKDRRPEAETILGRLRDALSRDELAVVLREAVERAVKEGIALLTRPSREAEPAPPAAERAKPAPGWKVIQRDRREGLDAEAAAKLFAELEARLRERGERRLRIDWTLEGP